jgi:type IV pilus assembly protein PilW
VKHQQGLTLVELMVAIVLSLLVADAAVSLFLANKKTAGTTTGVATISDNGRLALDMIGQSVRSAGYMACNSLNAGAGTIPVPAITTQLSAIAAGATPVQNNYGGTGTALFGYEASGTGPGGGTATAAGTAVTADTNSGDWANGGLDGLLTANSLTVPGVVNGTDVLVVREQLPQAVTMFTNAIYTPGTTTLIVNDASSLANVQLPHAAVISSCGASVAFVISGVTGNTITMKTALTIGFASGTSVAPIDTLIYYVGPGRDGDGALFVWDDGSNGTTPFSTELVPDVENMQVLYGTAPSAANQVTAYQTADAVAAAAGSNQEFNQVISVKVALLLASPPLTGAMAIPTAQPTFHLLGTTVTAPIDNRLRKVFDVTIDVRNASH